MSAEPQFPVKVPEKRSRHLSLVNDASSRTAGNVRGQRQLRALVPEAAPRNNRRLLITVFSLIPLVLILILLVNILTASRQYDLVDLRMQEQTLTQQNEALSQEIQYNQAPQDLAIRASQLGLYASSIQSTVNLQTGEIENRSGSETSSADKSQTQNLIDPPSLDDTDASLAADKRAKEYRAAQEAQAKAQAEASATAEPTNQASPAATSSQAASNQAE